MSCSINKAAMTSIIARYHSPHVSINVGGVNLESPCWVCCSGSTTVFPHHAGQASLHLCVCGDWS